MKQFAEYPKLRATEIIGHDQIPAHWDVRKVSRAFDLIGSGTTPNTNLGDYYDGDINWVTTAELREAVVHETQKKVTERAVREHSALRIYSPGSVAIAMYGATIGRLGILGAPATVNQACCVFDRSSVLDNRYFYYWLWSYRPLLLSLSSGGGQPNLSQDDLRSVRAPVPSLSEQTAIVDFLDRETARIDALIEKKRLLLELLEEKRLAVITHAVTKGLDPSAPMKDSGIDWLGQIPAHWIVRPLRYSCASVKTGNTPSSTGPDYFDDEGVDWFTPGEFGNRVELEGAARKLADEAFSEGACRLFPSGCVLLVGIGATLGKVGVVLRECSANQQINAIALIKEMIPHYLAYYLHGYRREVRVMSNASTLGILNQEKTKQIIVLQPPLNEQRDIVDSIQREEAAVERVKDRSARAIELLQEYRSALITNAVTGKIDVREAVQQEAAQ